MSVLGLAAGCAGSVADGGVTETLAPRATSTPFPTLAAAPPATAIPIEDDTSTVTQPADTPTTVPATSESTDAAASSAADSASTATDTSAGETAASGDTVFTSEPDPDAAKAFTTESKVTTVGLDEVYFGMTAVRAAEAADTQWVRSSQSASCAFLTPSGGPEGVRLWLWEGTVERVDVTNEGIRTPSGFGVGSTLTALQERLGSNLQVGETSSGGLRAVFVPADESDAAFRIVFEIGEDGTVVRYRSGRVGVVELDAASCT